jgi:hypothetical protein
MVGEIGGKFRAQRLRLSEADLPRWRHCTELGDRRHVELVPLRCASLDELQRTIDRALLLATRRSGLPSAPTAASSSVVDGTKFSGLVDG